MANKLTQLLPAKLRSKMGGDAVTIPVVRLTGTIMAGGNSFRPSLNLASCAGRLAKAFSDKKAPAVAIIVNSPGGSPVQSRLIYRRIRDLAAEKNKKVHVFVEDAAASGGYMIACAGDDIVADPSSIVGSIGVISSGFGFEGAIDKLGITRRVHTAGKNKSVMDPFLPEKKADIERLKKLQLEIHQVFIDLVRESRGDRLMESDDLFTGLFWTGQPALELGLVDELGDLRSVLKKRYGEKTKIKLIEGKRGLFGGRPASGISTLWSKPVDEMTANAADGLVAAMEDRAHWSRLGL